MPSLTLLGSPSLYILEWVIINIISLVVFDGEFQMFVLVWGLYPLKYLEFSGQRCLSFYSLLRRKWRGQILSPLTNGTSSVFIVMLGKLDIGMWMSWMGLNCHDCCSPWMPVTGKTPINIAFELPTIWSSMTTEIEEERWKSVPGGAPISPDFWWVKIDKLAEYLAMLLSQSKLVE